MNTKGYDYDRLYADLTTVSDRSRLFKTVKAAMIKRGRYKRKPRGSWAKSGVSGLQVHRERNREL